MEQAEFDQLKKLIRDTVGAAAETSHIRLQRSLDEHLRSDDHRFIKTLRDRERRNQEMWEKVKGNIVFWLLVSSTSAIGLAVWDYFFRHGK